MSIGVSELYLIACAVLISISILIGAIIYSRMRKVEDQMDFPEQSKEHPRVIASSGEYLASDVSEEIESLVHIKLQNNPEFENLRVDFATGTDEGLEIWVDDVRYTSVDDLPDERLRSIIHEAVDEYNRSRT
jgi:hypothetical protein